MLGRVAGRSREVPFPGSEQVWLWGRWPCLAPSLVVGVGVVTMQLAVLGLVSELRGRVDAEQTQRELPGS
jgi:hypothetical protein